MVRAQSKGRKLVRDCCNGSDEPWNKPCKLDADLPSRNPSLSLYTMKLCARRNDALVYPYAK
jgi:hypothetical protein